MVSTILQLEFRPLLHIALHILLPVLVALIFYRKRWLVACLCLLAGWLIDLDHLLAVPIYAPGRWSIGFHPLHSLPAITIYALLLLPRRARIFALGLLIHIGLDALDCCSI